MNNVFRITPIAAALAIGLSACGGSSNGTSGGPGSDGSPTIGSVVAAGVIEGFGSVIVNGVKYEVEHGRVFIESDDNGTDIATGQSDLQIGMVVTVTGDINSDGVTGTAQSIRFDDDLKGPVKSLDTSTPGVKTFTILGTTVIVSETDTVFDDTPPYSFADISENDVIEVSGLTDDQGRIVATFIEKKTGPFVANSTLVEVKGTVTNLDADNSTFTIGTLTVDYAGAVLDDNLGTLANDLFVEVKGTLSDDGATLTASKLEREGLGDTGAGVKASIEGLIADYDETAQTFRIGQQVISFAGTVSYQPATLEGQLGDGIKVEAEGPIVDGILQARVIKVRGGQIRIEAEVWDYDMTTNTVTFRMDPAASDDSSDIQVVVNSDTRGGSSAGIDIGAFLELRARPDVVDNSLLIATRVEVEEEADDYSLQGPTQAFDETAGTVTLLGITYTTHGGTEFEGLNDEVLTREQFFDRLAEGVLIKVKDRNDPDKADRNADLVADEIEFED